MENIDLKTIQFPQILMNLIGILIVLFLFFAIYYLINIGNKQIPRQKRISFDLIQIFKIIVGIIAIFIVHRIISKYTIIGDVISSTILSIIIAYVVTPFVDLMEKKGIQRKFGIIIIYVTVVLVLGILIFIVVPKTSSEITKLTSGLPGYIDRISEQFTELSDSYSDVLGSNFEKITDAVDNSFDMILEGFKNFMTNSISKATVFASALVGKVFGFLLTLIITFYFVVDKEKYTSYIKEKIPAKYNEDFKFLGTEINEVLYEFVRGRAILALFVGASTAIMLLILRVEFAIVIGVITCIADIIPYIGPFLGFIPAFIFALLQSPMKALWVGVFFVLLQWVENNILAPKIIGDKTGLPPLVIFLSIIIGGSVFGVWGMIISVPLTAVSIILFKFGREKYKERKIQKEKEMNMDRM
ncbi:MAG: AI-2E family transporter [Tissierellia bacterium]|nr:AI-2E family transporter [Tissierellia bacterium]